MKAVFLVCVIHWLNTCAMAVLCKIGSEVTCFLFTHHSREDSTIPSPYSHTNNVFQRSEHSLIDAEYESC